MGIQKWQIRPQFPIPTPAPQSQTSHATFPLKGREIPLSNH